MDEISYTIPRHAKNRQSRDAHETRRDRTKGPGGRGAAFDSFLRESRVLPTREQPARAPVFALAETQLTPIKDHCKPLHAPHEVTRCVVGMDHAHVTVHVGMPDSSTPSPADGFGG